jgi:hypothetical protein
MLAYAGQRMRAAARPEAPVREPRASRRSADDDDLDTWSEAPTTRAPRPAQPVAPTPVASTEPAAPADGTSIRPRRGRDRAVRREDARVTVDDPPDAPPRPGDAPPPRDAG